MVPPVPTPATRMSTVTIGVRPDLLGRGAGVDGRVGRVLELLGHEEVALTLGDLLGLGDGPTHAVGTRGEDQLGAVAPQQHPSLLAHGLRHGEDAPVATGGAHHGQGDAGVATGRLDHGRARSEQPGFLGGIDHGHGDPVLHAARRVEELEFGHDRCPGVVPDVAETHERGPADQLGDVVRNSHDTPPAFDVGREPAGVRIPDPTYRVVAGCPDAVHGRPDGPRLGDLRTWGSTPDLVHDHGPDR